MVEFEKSQSKEVRDDLLHKAELLKRRPYRRWSTHFGMIASLGGVIIVPILLGIWCGGYLDTVLPQHFSWRLSLLFVGFAWGAFNAYMWVKIENKKIDELETKPDFVQQGENNE